MVFNHFFDLLGTLECMLDDVFLESQGARGPS